MSEEWKWGWEAIGALGNWFAGVVTAFGVYAALRRPQPKVKVKAKIQEIIYKETPRGKFGLWVKNVHTLPVTIEEIGIIIRKPWFQNFTWNKLTGKYFTWGKQYHSLSQFKVVEDESQKRSMEHRIIPVKLPFRLDQEESTPELSIDFVRLANLLKGWTHDTCVIQFCFRDIRDRIYCSKRFLVRISSLEKYLQPSIWIRDEVPELKRESRVGPAQTNQSPKDRKGTTGESNSLFTDKAETVTNRESTE